MREKETDGILWPIRQISLPSSPEVNDSGTIRLQLDSLQTMHSGVLISIFTSVASLFPLVSTLIKILFDLVCLRLLLVCFGRSRFKSRWEMDVGCLSACSQNLSDKSFCVCVYQITSSPTATRCLRRAIRGGISATAYTSETRSWVIVRLRRGIDLAMNHIFWNNTL